MTKITKEEVRKVAELARLELNENEINNHAEQLEKIPVSYTHLTLPTNREV